MEAINRNIENCDFTIQASSSVTSKQMHSLVLKRHSNIKKKIVSLDETKKYPLPLEDKVRKDLVKFYMTMIVSIN